jgi:Concanavalin A-like lectin/glucanases superfamily
MSRLKKYSTTAFAVFLGMGLLIIAGCEKVEHPGLETGYPKDANPPTGPLNFYAAFNGIYADSIRATFPSTDSTTSFVAGPNDTALQFNPVLGSSGADSIFSYLVYSVPNNWGNTSSFSVSFWMMIPLSKKDNVNADGLLTYASTSNFWGEMTWYVDHTTGGPADSMDLKVHFANGSGDNWDFANYTGTARWPGMYDGNWHMISFVYDANAMTGTMYKDGVQFDQKTNETIAFDGNASNLIIGGFEEVNNINSTISANTWMNGFPGAVANVRLYSSVLAASDIATLYANKQ